MSDKRPLQFLVMRAGTLLGALLLVSVPAAAAETHDIGLTAKGGTIRAAIVRGSSDSAPVVAIVGGLSGQDASSRAVLDAIDEFDQQPQARRRYTLIGIAAANPDGSVLVFPPTGTAYRVSTESHVLWRWIGIHAPDLVLIAGADSASLTLALSEHPVAGIGRIPARRLDANARLLQAIPQTIVESEARREINGRRRRSPREVAGQLAKIYGQDFEQFTYIPGMALIGRLRLGQTADVERLVAPYVTGVRDPLERPNSLVLAGHLVMAELAARTENPAYLAALRKAVDLGFTESGEMKESMPFHDEMSDSLFMATAILARAGVLTGERRYFDMAARHVAFMQKLVFRPDGLYQHSPLTDAAWGRGNGFPALGLALTLESFPKDHPGFAPVLQSFQRHMAALARFQDSDGLWHQVIDHPGSYAEFSATAMIGTSMLIGIRHGWLDAKTYQPLVDGAWRAVNTRTASDGVLLDVCESTNKQRTLDDYLRRAALTGRDPRGGAMALVFATELAGLGR
ncbi:MAG TPA: glycoside hydrolase family 88 protein [Vicinamibacterales bacterium]|nr:glycoside hydrolase family 88 protein [Vicinamibacterales bacterium]